MFVNAVAQVVQSSTPDTLSASTSHIAPDADRETVIAAARHTVHAAAFIADPLP